MQKILSLILITSFLFLSGCGEGDGTHNIKIPGVTGPNVSLHEDNVLISMVFDNLSLDGGGRFVVPKYPNSYIELSPDLQSVGTMLAINVSLYDVFNEDVINELDPMTLPGGRPLPGVIGGTLPASAFEVDQLKNMAFYLGPKVFGVFVHIPNLGMNGGMISSRFYVKGKRLGNIHLIGQDVNGENGGVLLMLDLTEHLRSRLARYLDSLD